MSKLLRYEFRKSWGTKLILLGITAMVELGFLLSLLLRNENVETVCIVLLVMLTFGGIFFIGLQSVLILHRDMNTRQGYMLFMTPNSCYRILGAKVLENGLSILVAGAFFALLGTLDVTLLLARHGQLNELKEMLQSMMRNFFPAVRMNLDVYLSLFFAFLCNWLATITTAYLADVLASAVLRGRKFGGFAAFLLFIALESLLVWLEGLVRAPLSIPTVRLLLLTACLDLGFSAVLYWLAALIMDRKLSV